MLKLAVLAFSAALFLGLSCKPRNDLSSNSTGSLGTSTIRGLVFNHEGNPIAKATIVLEGPALGGVRQASTDSFGFFIMKNLPSGKDYRISVSVPDCVGAKRCCMNLEAFTTFNLLFDACDFAGNVPMGWAMPMIDYGKAGSSTIITGNPVTGEPERSFK